MPLNDTHRTDVHRCLKGIVGLQSYPLLRYAMKRADGRWDCADRNGTITVQDEPPAGAFTEVRIIES